MPSQFEKLLENLKALTAEAEAATRALRALEGQAGPSGPSGNTRTSYIRGVESGNVHSAGSQSVGNVMPIAVTAVEFGLRGGGYTPVGSKTTSKSLFGIHKRGQTLNEERLNRPYEADLLVNLRQGILTQNRMEDYRVRKILEGKYSPFDIERFMMNQHASPLNQHRLFSNESNTERWERLVDQQNTIFGSMTRQATGKTFPSLYNYGVLSQAGQRLENIAGRGMRGPTGGFPVRYSNFPGQPTPAIRGAPINYRGGFNIQDTRGSMLPSSAFSKGQTWGQSVSGISKVGMAGAAAGAGLAVLRELANEQNSPYRLRYSAPGGSYADPRSEFYGTSNAFQNIGLAAQRAAPNIARIGLNVFMGTKALSAISIGRTAGLKSAASSLSMGGMGAVASAGSMLLFSTAINAIPDATETFRTLITGNEPVETFENRMRIHQMKKNVMWERQLNNMRGRQGITDHVERKIQQEADRQAQKVHGILDLSSSFGGHDNAARELFSWATFGLVRGRKKLREESEKVWAERAEDIEKRKTKAWASLSNGDFNKARTLFHEAAEMSKIAGEGVPAGWKDPMKIYTAMLSAKISQRHYAASFITRPILRTGD